MKTSDHSKQPPVFLTIVIMALTGGFGFLATDIYAPMLPSLPTIFNTSTSLAQLTTTLFLISFSVTQLVAGVLSDSFGRKPILIVGLLIFFIGTFICIIASKIFVFSFGRIIQGIGTGAISVLSRVFLRDVFAGTDMARIGSYIAMAIGLSPMLAPAIGGILQTKFGFTSISIFLLLFSSLILCISIFKLQETNQFKHLNILSVINIVQKLKLILSTPLFLVNVLASGCALSVMISCGMINPFLSQKILNISIATYSAYASLVMSGVFFGLFINARIVINIGVRRMMLAGMVIIFLIGIFILFFSLISILSVGIVMFPTFIVTMAAAIIMANAVVGAFTPFPEIAGTVGALYGCMQIFITAIVSFIVSALGEPTHFMLGTIITGLMVCSATAYFYYGKEKEP